MKNSLRICLLVATSVAGTEVRAQQQASTLFSLSHAADAVCVATATASTDPSPAWRRVEFQVDETLKGAVRATFAVLEPAGRCCGAALLDAEPGKQFVMFLTALGGALHPLAGDRGIVIATPAIRAHVRAMLAIAGDAASEARLLAQSLDSSEGRVSQDAALALASHPHAIRDPNVKQALAQALDRCLAAPTTALPALATTLARAEDAGAALALMPRYLRAPTAAGAAGLRRTLACLPSAELAAALRAESIVDEQSCIRAAELLEQQPDVAQLDVLQRLLREARTPRAAAHVASALLDHGVEPKSLAQQVHKSVLAAAIQRRKQRDAGANATASPMR